MSQLQGGLTGGAKTYSLKPGYGETKVKAGPGVSRSIVAAFLLNHVTDKTYVIKSVWLND